MVISATGTDTTSDKESTRQYVKRIGSKNSELPREVRLTDGSISSEPQKVLDRWADAFEKLLNDNFSVPDVRLPILLNVQNYQSDILSDVIIKEKIIKAIHGLNN